MSSHREGRSRRRRAKRHLLLVAFLAACAVVAWHRAWTRAAIGSVAAALGLHAGAAVAAHAGLALASGGLAATIVRSHRRRRDDDDAPGATLHSPRFYDLTAAIYCLGRERRLRERMLDVAGVAVGDHVLDVCCGTGTLALAAHRRVGAEGSVDGVDASAEMLARAETKARRAGAKVTFRTAAAQALPYPDATFDVALCTLALHHLDDDARAAAIAEMRRVVRPGGRVLVVEFGEGRGLSALLHPVAIVHRRKTRILDGVVATMKRVGFARVETANVGFAGLGYAVAHRGLPHRDQTASM